MDVCRSTQIFLSNNSLCQQVGRKFSQIPKKSFQKRQNPINTNNLDKNSHKTVDFLDKSRDFIATLTTKPGFLVLMMSAVRVFLKQKFDSSVRILKHAFFFMQVQTIFVTA